MSSTSVVSSPVSTGKLANIGLWAIQVVLALAFAAAAAGKLAGSPDMVGLFDAIGLGQWFRVLTGLLELGGAVLLVVRRTRLVGAALLASVMLGAIATHLFVLHSAPTAAVVLFALAGLVAWARRHDAARLLAG